MGCGDDVDSVPNDAGVATCSMGPLNDAASFDASTLPPDPIACQTDEDCEAVVLSTDCGNGCVTAYVNTNAAAAISKQLSAAPEQRCSACSMLEAWLTFSESCSDAPITPVCVANECRLYHPIGAL
jgi:hypothetical protein